MNEETTAANYIHTFNQSMVSIIYYWSELKRRILACQGTVSLQDLKTGKTSRLNTDQLKHIQQAFNTLMFHIDVTFAFSQSLQNQVPSFQDPEITKLYRATENSSLPEIATIEKYVIKINTAFADKTMQKLLTSTQEVYEKLRGNTNE